MLFLVTLLSLPLLFLFPRSKLALLLVAGTTVVSDITVATAVDSAAKVGNESSGGGDVYQKGCSGGDIAKKSSRYIYPPTNAHHIPSGTTVSIKILLQPLFWPTLPSPPLLLLKRSPFQLTISRLSLSLQLFIHDFAAAFATTRVVDVAVPTAPLADVIVSTCFFVDIVAVAPSLADNFVPSLTLPLFP